MTNRRMQIRAWLATVVGLLVGLLAGGLTSSPMNSAAAGEKPAIARKTEASPHVVAGQAGSIQIASGRSAACQWVAYGSAGITMQVDTSAAGFTGIPNYVTSIGGNGSQWLLTGTGAIYSPDNGDLRTGFRIYLRWSNGSSLSPATACSNGWYVQWVGSE